MKSSMRTEKKMKLVTNILAIWFALMFRIKFMRLACPPHSAQQFFISNGIESIAFLEKMEKTKTNWIIRG